jgi:hypothetical protein
MNCVASLKRTLSFSSLNVQYIFYYVLANVIVHDVSLLGLENFARLIGHFTLTMFYLSSYLIYLNITYCCCDCFEEFVAPCWVHSGENFSKVLVFSVTDGLF